MYNGTLNILLQFVTCEQDVIDLLAIGGANRATSSTNMNKVSSRSHRYVVLLWVGCAHCVH